MREMKKAGRRGEETMCMFTFGLKRSLLSSLGICLCLTCGTSFGEGTTDENGPRPKWKVGTWWVTETHYLMSISTNPNIWYLGDQLYYHKWLVVGQETIGDKNCWAVEIRPQWLPPSVKNELGDDYLAKLWLDVQTYVLRQAEFNTRLGEYNVSGAPKGPKTYPYSQGKPVIIDRGGDEFTGCPLDVPVLPSHWCFFGVSAKDKTQDYESENTHAPQTQVLTPWSTIKYIDLGNHLERWRDQIQRPAMFVTLISRHEMRTQLWMSGYPWWVEWHSTPKDGDLKYMWYSRMVDWSEKKDDRLPYLPALPAPEAAQGTPVPSIPAQSAPHEEKPNTETPKSE